MSDKTQRHAVLARVVREEPVESQEELLEALASAGLEVHQSTLSRDLRELGIRKVRGHYRAVPPPPPLTSAEAGSSEAVALPVVHGFTPCGPNLITVRAGTGQAQLLGVLLDREDDPNIAGTIAGDDTVLVVTRGRVQQRAVLALLTRWFGEEKHDAG